MRAFYATWAVLLSVTAAPLAVLSAGGLAQGQWRAGALGLCGAAGFARLAVTSFRLYRRERDRERGQG
jgi:hypothetical protein